MDATAFFVGYICNKCSSSGRYVFCLPLGLLDFRLHDVRFDSKLGEKMVKVIFCVTWGPPSPSR